MRRFATCLLIAVFAASGCGGDDSETDGFSEGYNAAIQRLARVNADLAQLQTSRSSRAIAREFERFGAALDSTGTELKRLQPPEEAAREFNALVDALDEAVDASREAAAAARKIRPAAQRRAVRRLRRATMRVSEAEDALRQAVAAG